MRFPTLPTRFRQLLSGARRPAPLLYSVCATRRPAVRGVPGPRRAHFCFDGSRWLVAAGAVLLVCAAALSPMRVDARDAVHAGTAEPASVSATTARADAQSSMTLADPAGERSSEMPPAAGSLARPAPGAASKSVPTTLAVVDQPRAIGYFVGDRVTQRVLLERNGRAVVPVTLPSPGRVSAWFERRAANVQTDDSSHHWLVVQYQILNAPPKLITVKLPAWTLAIKSDTGTAPAALRIPEALVNVAPLSPPGSPTQVGTADLRADHPPPTIATAPLRRAIAFSAGALVLTLVAWLAWTIWRNRRAQATQPFARALREMRTLEDREPRAWQALHRAFDRTAGRVIQSATLPTLFERAPQLIPARGEIERFFAQSNLLFFGAAPASGATSPPGATAASDATSPPRAAAASGATSPPRAPAASGASSPPGAVPPPPAATAASSDTAGPSPKDLCVELRRIEKRHEQ